MEITAKLQKDGGYDLQLSGAPSKSVLEVRWQDTIFGSTFIQVVETVNGVARLDTPRGFGQHFVPRVRVLDDNNNVKLSTFKYDSTDNAGDLKLEEVVPSDAPAAQAPTKPIDSHIPAQPAP